MFYEYGDSYCHFENELKWRLAKIKQQIWIHWPVAKKTLCTEGAYVAVVFIATELLRHKINWDCSKVERQRALFTWLL